MKRALRQLRLRDAVERSDKYGLKLMGERAK